MTLVQKSSCGQTFPNPVAVRRPGRTPPCRGWHDVDHLAGDFSLGLLRWQSPGAKAAADQYLVAQHRDFSEGAAAVIDCSLPAKPPALLDHLDVPVALELVSAAALGTAVDLGGVSTATPGVAQPQTDRLVPRRTHRPPSGKQSGLGSGRAAGRPGKRHCPRWSFVPRRGSHHCRDRPPAAACARSGAAFRRASRVAIHRSRTL